MWVTPMKHEKIIDNIPKQSEHVEESTIKFVAVQELGDVVTEGPEILANNYGLIGNLKVKLDVVVGSTEISVNELFALKKGSQLRLEQSLDCPLVLRLDGKNIATGKLVVVDDNFGIQILNILNEQK